MKKWFIIFIIVLMTTCSACSDGVRVYYASSGGSSVSINVNGIDQVPRTNEWIDSEAEMHKQIDVLGKTVEGDYKKTYQNDTRTARDEYEGTEKDKNLNFTVDRKTLMPNTSGLTICRALY